MSMPSLDLANCVVVAQQFNPSILSEHWLAKHGLIADSPDDRNMILVPGFTRVETAGFILEARADRLQFVVRDPQAGESPAPVTETVGRIVSLLPETPYRGVGLNFHWTVVTADRDRLAGGLREMLVKQGSPIYDLFVGTDARFGAYLSKDILGLRMRVDIKPVTATRAEDGAVVEGLVYHFNFHKDVDEERAVEQIQEALALWGQALAVSQEIFSTTAGWIGNG